MNTLEIFSISLIGLLILFIVMRYYTENNVYDGILYSVNNTNNKVKFIKYINLTCTKHKFNKIKGKFKFINLTWSNNYDIKILTKTSDNVNLNLKIKLKNIQLIFDNLFTKIQKEVLTDNYELRDYIYSIEHELNDYHIQNMIHKLLLSYSKNDLIQNFDKFKLELITKIQDLIKDYNYPFIINEKEVLISYEWKI